MFIHVRRITFLAITLALMTLTGCSTLLERTHRLGEVHQIYTEDWLAAKISSPNSNPRAVGQKGAFDPSLAAIRNYKAQFGDSTTVAAHLTVLEGLIYLQSGSLGMAKLLEPEVAEAEKSLSSRGSVATRDFLIAACYPELVTGWSAIQRMYSGDTTLVIDDFEKPAVGISETLARMSDKEAANSDVDSGGAYVATSAAIFYLWASQFQNGPDKIERRAGNIEAGRNTLEPWMSVTEIAAVKDGSYDDPGMDWGGRERFVEWYAFLAGSK